MHLRRAEFVFWTLVILVAPWSAYGAWVGFGGQPRGDAPLRLAVAGFAVALWFAIGGALPWHLAWASRVPIVACSRWFNRRWRWTYAIAPEPIRRGPRSIWVSKALAPSEQSAAARVAEALDVLATVQPSRAARLGRLGVHLAVMPIGSPASYLPSANVVALDPVTLDEAVPVLAGIIVHESSHALLASRRLLHPLLTQRVERMARRDQLLFGRRLLLRGQVEEAYRLKDWAVAAAQADLSFLARWKRVKAGVDRLYEGAARNDA